MALLKETLMFLTRLLQQMNQPTVLDVGANIGNHSLVFSLHAKQVYAFEPIPAIFDLLQNNIAQNAITNITAIQTACSNTNEETIIHLNQAGNLGGSGFG